MNPVSSSMLGKKKRKIIKTLSLIPKPATAWSLIFVFLILIISSILLHVSQILQLAFPAGSFIIAVFLYSKYPSLYIGFNWWIWFLSPLVSRIVEYQSGTSGGEFKMIILSPYLVSFVCTEYLFRYGPQFVKKDGLPYMLATTSILYAFIVGFLREYSLLEIGRGVLMWFPAISIGFYLNMNWRNYPIHMKITQDVFFWATLVMGAYGMYQYAFAPAWDVFWWNNSPNLQSSIGWPEPYMLRVWSTVNTPMVFSVTMITTLTFVFSNYRKFSILAILPGFISFLLSLVRAAWLGWGLTFIGVFIFSNFRVKSFMIRNIFLGLLFSSPLLFNSNFTDTVLERIQTFLNVGSDGSLLVRQRIYADLLNQIVSEVIGRGMGGAGTVDAGLLEPLAILGWIGLAPYVCAIFLIFYTLNQCLKYRKDSFILASIMSSVGMFSTLSSNNMFILLPSVLFWGISGLAIAGYKYRSNQEKYNLQG